MGTKVFALSALLLASCLGTTSQAPRNYSGAVKVGGRGGFDGGGRSRQEQYPPQPYQFDHKVQDELENTNYQQEQGDSNGKEGYGYIDVDGVHRIVEYETDANRLGASIRSNEPGIKPESQANIVLDIEPPPQTVVDKYIQSDDDGGKRGGGNGDGRGGRIARFAGGGVRKPPPPGLVVSIGAYGGEAGGGGR